MKITVDAFIGATAKAMSKKEAVKLIKCIPGTMKMFTLFSTLILCETEDKDIDEDDYDGIVGNIIAEITPEDADTVSMLKMLSLITFADDIWENLKREVSNR